MSYIRYHWVNKKSGSQDKDDFYPRLNKNGDQITILIPFTDLDVKVETKMKEKTYIANKTKMVHCYVKPHSYIFIRKEMKYQFLENTGFIDRRWLYIKMTMMKQDTDV